MKKIYWSLALTFTLSITTLCILSFGNPQWGRWVYRWQCYILERNVHTNIVWIKNHGIERTQIKILSNYKGVWKHWPMRGLPYCVTYFDDSGKEVVLYDKDKNIDNRKKYKHLLKDHPELLEGVD